jgi:uncharacterized repeat protein (TIGR03803 family)
MSKSSGFAARVDRRTALACLGGLALAPMARAADHGFQVIHEFQGVDGIQPNGSLLQAADGRLWGTAMAGGPRGAGVVFKLSTGGRTKVMHSFTQSGGNAPAAGLTLGADGLLYGTTSTGGDDVSTLFRMDWQGRMTVLHEFTIGGDTGFNPTTELLATTDGNIYGTARDFSRSIAFRLAPTGEVTRLHYFTEDEGSHASTLVQGPEGAFYGVMTYHGPKNVGTAFRMTPDGVVTVLYAFGRRNGKPHRPNSLMRAADGLFYGTTVFGGAADLGTVFRMTAAGELTVLHEFAGADGARPSGRLIQAANGHLYGVTQAGGRESAGVLYRLATDGSRFRIAHHFVTDAGDPPTPFGSLLEGSDGRLYASTMAGGAAGAGTVYRVKAV